MQNASCRTSGQRGGVWKVWREWLREGVWACPLVLLGSLLALADLQGVVSQADGVALPCNSSGLGRIVFNGSQNLSDCNSTRVKQTTERDNSISECVTARILKFCQFENGPLLHMSNCLGRTCNRTFPDETTMCFLIGMGYGYTDSVSDGNHTCGISEEFSHLFREELVSWVVPNSGRNLGCQPNIPSGAKLSRKFICVHGAPRLVYTLQLREDIAKSTFSYTLDPLCSISWGISGVSVFRSEESQGTQDAINECVTSAGSSAAPLIRGVLSAALMALFI